MWACLQNLQLANGALAAVLAKPLKYTIAVVPMLAGQADHGLLQLQLALADATLLHERAQSLLRQRLMLLCQLQQVSYRISDEQKHALADSTGAKPHSSHAACTYCCMSADSEECAMFAPARASVGCTT